MDVLHDNPRQVSPRQSGCLPAALLWLTVIALLVLNRQCLFHLLAGPVRVDSAVVSDTPRLSRMEGGYLLIEARDLERLFPHSTSLGKEPYTYYGSVTAGDKRLLVLLPTSPPATQLAGILEPSSPYEQKHLLPRLRARDLTRDFVPYRFNATRPIWSLGFLLTIVPTIGLAGAAAWLTARRPFLHAFESGLIFKARTPRTILFCPESAEDRILGNQRRGD